jgi:hypothetical protein
VVLRSKLIITYISKSNSISTELFLYILSTWIKFCIIQNYFCIYWVHESNSVLYKIISVYTEYMNQILYYTKLFLFILRVHESNSVLYKIISVYTEYMNRILYYTELFLFILSIWIELCIIQNYFCLYWVYESNYVLYKIISVYYWVHESNSVLYKIISVYTEYMNWILYYTELFLYILSIWIEFCIMQNYFCILLSTWIEFCIMQNYFCIYWVHEWNSVLYKIISLCMYNYVNQILFIQNNSIYIYIQENIS